MTKPVFGIGGFPMPNRDEQAFAFKEKLHDFGPRGTANEMMPFAIHANEHSVMKDAPMPDHPPMKVIATCQVTMLTFGGKQVYDMEPQDFHYGSILTSNEHYTVFQNGLNFYVFPTVALDLPVRRPEILKYSYDAKVLAWQNESND